MKNIFWLLSLFVVLAGCQQDPLKDYPDNVRNGIAPEARPEKPDNRPTPEAAYVLVINKDEPIVLAEETDSTIEIVARIFKSQLPTPVTKFEVRVLNLDEFPNATMTLKSEIPLDDPKETLVAEKVYELKWKPTAGMTGSSTSSRKRLRVGLFTNDKADMEVGSTKSAIVLVEKKLKAPEVIDVTWDAKEIIEGNVLGLTLTVKDEDSTQVEPPRLKYLRPTYSKRDLSSYLFPVDVRQDPATGNWIFKLELDLRYKEITKSLEDFYVHISAVSRFGVQSQGLEKSLAVRSALREPVSSMADQSSFTFNKGTRNSFSFTVSDIFQDGEVSGQLVGANSSLSGVRFSCRNPAGKPWVANCEFTWDIPASATLKPSYDFVAELKNRSTAGWFVGAPKILNVNFKVNIGSPVVPTPLPEPQPNSVTPANGGAQ